MLLRESNPRNMTEPIYLQYHGWDDLYSVTGDQRRTPKFWVAFLHHTKVLCSLGATPNLECFEHVQVYLQADTQQLVLTDARAH